MKKKILSLIIAAAAAVCTFPVISAAADENDPLFDDLNYKITDDGTVTITNCMQNAKECTIPEKIDGAPVTAVADSAFSECYFLETVTVPDCVKKIGRQAFSACSVLKSIKLPKELESMGEGVFDGCPVLEAVALPAGITELPEATFYECEGLKSVEFQEGLEVIGSESFYGCTSLSDIKFPESLTSIGDYAFQNCESVKHFELTENVVNLGKYIFQSCGSLTNIDVDEKNAMFTDADGVLMTKDGNTLVRYPEARTETEYRIPDGCTQLANGSFVDAVHLKSIDLNGAVTYGMDVFFRCTGLESITVPEGAESVAPNMFAYCSSMKEVKLPSTLKSVDSYGFYTCAALTEIEFPDGLERLGQYSLFNCIELRDVYLPDTVTEIGDGAIGYYAESDDKEPIKLDGVTVHFGTNDVIDSFVTQYDLDGTGRGKLHIWKWLLYIGGAAAFAGIIVLIVVLRKRAYTVRPVKGGRTGSAVKRENIKKG